MGPSVVRLTAFATAASAFALEELVQSWPTQQHWRNGSIAIALALIVAGLLLSLAVPFGAYVLLGALVWRRSLATFWVDQRRQRFVAHAVHHQTLSAIALAWVLARTLATPPAPPAIRLVAAGATLAVSAAILLLDRPRVELTPAGLTVQALGQRTHRAWDDLEYHEPPASIKDPRLWFLRVRNATPAQFVQVRVGALDSNTAFLTAALRHYAEDPAHRSAIGTAAELDRLLTVRGEPTAAAI